MSTELHLVFLHGWGMNQAIFTPFIKQFQQLLAAQERLHSPCGTERKMKYVFKCIDLPGFGTKVDTVTEPYSLEHIAEVIYQEIPENSVIVAWSLGGLIAQLLADKKFERVLGHIQIASSPKFSSADDWYGIKEDTLAQFFSQLKDDHLGLLKRFLAIQNMGVENARSNTKEMLNNLSEYRAPCVSTLEKSLLLLQKTDLRGCLASSSKPCLRLYGKLDALVPVKAVPAIDDLCKHANSAIFSKASHAPFISHPNEVISEIMAFLEDDIYS